jgi:cell division protein FtsZ
MDEMMKLSELSAQKKLDVRVIGIGGAGCSSLRSVAESGFVESRQLSLLGIDTGSAVQTLNGLTETLSFGNGFGSGGDIDAAIDQFLTVRRTVERFVARADVVVILAGLGRGTGSAVSPLVAELAKSTGALTIAAVNMPFKFEGRFRKQSAKIAHARLEKSTDAVITTSNSELSKPGGASLSLNDAFREADKHTADTVQAIMVAFCSSADRFETIRSSFENAGKSLILAGSASGLHAGKSAVAGALDGIENESLDVKNAVIHVDGGIGLSLGQVAEAVTALRTSIDGRAEIHVSSERHVGLGQDIRVTLMLTGVDQVRDLTETMSPIGDLQLRDPIPSVSIFDSPHPVRTRGPVLLPTA